MEVLKIELTQNKANYRREETVDNAMTYPLPPIHTVTGAIHSFCRWHEYHDMSVGIQGHFGSINKELHNRNVFYNSTMPDRGFFVKMASSASLSNAYILIAEPLYGDNSRGRNIRTGKGYKVLRPDLVREYIDTGEKIKELKRKIGELNELKRGIPRNDKEERARINQEIEKIKESRESAKKEHERFRAFERIPSYIETLTDIRLILHIAGDDINEVYDNIDNLTAIGRSEDFVDVKSASIIECSPASAGDAITESAYIRYSLADHFCNKDGSALAGTAYYLNKKYEIENGKRVFEKERCIWASDVKLKTPCNGVFIDTEGTVFNLL